MAIVWFRADLRLDDNPALAEAIRSGSVIPLFIWSDEEPWALGAASRWWLHQSLVQLDKQLHRVGSRLIVRRGEALGVLKELLNETGDGAVYWNRRYEPALLERDRSVKAALTEAGIEVKSFNGSLLYEPWQIQNSSGQPFQVFTPFWKACSSIEPARPVDAPALLPSPERWPKSLSIDALELEPKVDWAAGMRSYWKPGTEGARLRLDAFLERVGGYADERDRPDLESTSSLSPHLHFGEVSVRRVYWECVMKRELDKDSSRGVEVYLKEVGWREFAYHLLYHFPHTPDVPLKSEFANFPWVEDVASLKIWQKGETGYPLVDAGMRQLWQTGWMHNRVRMVVASFLVKHLLISWQHGARWFWDTLVDADLANNTLGWQWTAGCGADAAPYFRIFNPVTQGEKFDKTGAYVRRWVPELSALPDSFIHRPWEAPAVVLQSAGVRLGWNYPRPIVDHKAARDRALDALSSISKTANAH